MCCGPCSSYPVKKLREMGYEPNGYFFNPNIHPYKEFKHRLETAIEFAGKVNLPIAVDKEYTLEDFLTKALTAPNPVCNSALSPRAKALSRRVPTTFAYTTPVN